VDPAFGTVIVIDAGAVPEAMGADVVILDVPPGDRDALGRATAMAARLAETPVPVLALDGHLGHGERMALYRSGVLSLVDPGGDPAELEAQLESLVSAKWPASPAVRRLQEHSRHLDEQLRLAQRLQMDFLPRRLPQPTDASFAARLEPAAWVAGDFYDVFRLDERHLGFYVADAVGHGIPAALLTVFVKKSLHTKRIEGNDYELVSPAEVLAGLNRDLLSADLRETPFVTLVYCLYDMAEHELTWARAGHPRPLLAAADGSVAALPGEGPLLGIFSDATFEQRSRTLEPGERLLLYSDGAERVEPVQLADPERLVELVEQTALLPLEAALDEIVEAVHAASGGRRLPDDVTLLALERDGPHPQS
jgi:sigma-B regulation protein RsbU (phosphoserine phosphatase)